MNKTIYRLQIECSNDNQANEISKLLKIQATDCSKNIWHLEIEEKENEPYFDFINHFLDLLDDKYNLLNIIGIKKEDISIWLLYPYKTQCNLEFLPKDLNRIGSKGISLCISCWSISSNVVMGNGTE